MLRSSKTLVLDRPGRLVARWRARRASHGVGLASPARKSSRPSARASGSSRTGSGPTAPGPRSKPRRTDRDDQPGDAGLADRRREARLARRSSGARRSSAASARSSSTAPTRICAADHGLRRRRAGARPRADRRQCRLAGARPASSSANGFPGREPGPITRPADASRRQLQHPVRAAGLECRQRGRHRRQAGGLGALARLFRAVPESRRRLGLYAQAQAINRQHDLRRASPA